MELWFPQMPYRASRLLDYALAICSPLLALLLVWNIQGNRIKVPLYPLFTLVVLLNAVLGGFFPGLVAVAVSAFVIYGWLLPGYLKITGNLSGWLSFVMFLGVGTSTASVVGALRRSRRGSQVAARRYRTLFDSIDEGFCVVEMIFDEAKKPIDYRFLEVNPAFERHFQLGNVKGKTVRELLPALETHWFELFGRVAVTGEPTRYCDQALNRWYEGYAFRVGEPKQHRIGVLFQDVTQRKQAEEALIRSEKLAATGRLAATIAHEVNNPLAAALNAVYVASSAADLPPQTTEMLALADHELRRAAHIVQQGLGFYRERNTGTPVALPKVIDEILAVYATKLRARNITVKTRYTCGPCDDCDGCFMFNSGELRQVISNLLANGMDAISDGGMMQVRLSRVSHPATGEPQIQLVLADDGCGIRAENMKRIFEPFFTTKEAFGTGLGLWVTQELVQKHNGTIKVRSRIGKGTVFRICVPALPVSVVVEPNFA